MGDLCKVSEASLILHKDFLHRYGMHLIFYLRVDVLIKFIAEIMLLFCMKTIKS